MKKRLLSILLTACLLMGLLPTVALAEDGVPYLDDKGVETTYTGEYTKITVDNKPTTWTTGWYVVQGEVTIGSAESPSRVTVSGDVHLILADGCELTVNGGIQVQDNDNNPNNGSPNALTIYAQSTDENTMGKLNANVATYYNTAVIGGGTGSTGGSGGTITINGGIVVATSAYGAAIGSGYGNGNSGGYGGGTITINGGVVTATSTYRGAGIGGGGAGSGTAGSGGNITINGGTITASGGGGGAGIGGGGDNGGTGGSGGNITINGGTITASGGGGGAGIGSGYGTGGNGNNGTFKTNNGNAVIFASSIGDKSGKADWSGIIFEGDSGAVYGTQTLTGDLTIPAGKTLTIPSGTSLTIPEGKTLTIPEGATLTNNGTVNNSGALYVDGALSETVSGDVYYPLTLKDCTATPTSTYNDKTYGKAGSDITLTPVAPLNGLTFAKWNTNVVVDENGKFTMPSAALTVTAQFTWDSDKVAEVSSEDQLRLAIDSGATSIKLMDDFQLANDAITLNDKEITLDLNGFYIVSSDYSRYTDVFVLEDTSAGGKTSLTLIDSNPGASHWTDTLPKGGLIRGKITMTVKSGGTNCQLIANGGSVTGQVGLQSTYTSIRCTNDSPTAFYNDALSYGKIYGGIFYGNYTVIGIQGKTVTFKYNNETYAREVVESGKTAVAPIPPQEPNTETGYHINWYKGNDTVSYDFSTPVDNDITLTAKWENKYRITFDTAGGTPIAPTMQEYNTNVTVPEAPTKTGYTFEGWKPATVPMEDTTVTAQWTPNQYNITYEGMEGADFGEKHPTTHTYDTATEISNPTKTGYTFVGWLVNGEGTPVRDLTLGATGYTDNITLTAVWTPNVYNVTLITNGGTIRAGDVTEYTYGVGAKLPVFVTKTGYNFAGWYDNEECMGRPVTEITTTDIENKTFYAAWTPAALTYPPTVTQPEGGSVTVSPKYPIQGTKVTITATPDEGYEVDEITVTDKNGNPVEVTDNGDGTFTFTQPYGKVTITVTFKETEVEPETDPVKDCLKDGTCPASKFTDVKMDWTHDGIHFCVENGLMNGTSDTTFEPDSNLSRAMLMTILARLDGVDTTGGENWYEKGLAWAVANGISDGTNGDANITREQIVTMLYRYAVYKGYDVSVGEDTNILSFADAEEISSWAKDAMQWAVGAGLINGKGENNLDPTGKATRAEMAAILYRFCENVAE